MVDGEARRQRPGGPGVGAGRGGHRGRDGELAGAAGVVGRRRHDDDLHCRRRVPLARVEGVVPAALEEVAVLEVQAVGQDLADPVHHPAHHLGLEAERVDRQADVDRAHGLGHARPGVGVLDLAVDRRRPAIDLDQAGGVALVLAVDADALRGAGRHRAAPVADRGHLVEDCLHAGVPDEGAPELERVLAHRLGELVDHQLPRRGHLGAVDVADRAGVEGVGLVDLVEQLSDDAEVVGHVRRQVEEELRVAEVAHAGLRELRGEQLAETVVQVGGDARVALVEREHVPAQVERPHARGDHRVDAALAEVVRAVPHQLDRLGHRLRDGGGLEGGVGEQVAPERPAALRHVRLHLGHRQPQVERRSAPAPRSAS